MLLGKYHYKPENVLVLTDDLHDESQRPTRVNMINAMQWLVKDAKRHDSLFFHCKLVYIVKCRSSNVHS
jgi:hypothetical protein